MTTKTKGLISMDESLPVDIKLLWLKRFSIVYTQHKKK
jgi:hypothetical protein